MQTSARNAFEGRVAALERGAVNTLVTVDIGGDQTIVATITNDSAERLGLAEDRDVTALIKATSVLVSTAGDNRTSARNFLSGTVREVVPGAVNSVVLVDIGGGRTLTATVTNESVKRLGLEKGSATAGLFKASAVILATGD
ncbi:MAG TPA: TOBE domain-containing protein [Gammaproteobacteria bacterium]|nr:TOBE domain-containing protein [Gammaproteobacteria bacterium]